MRSSLAFLGITNVWFIGVPDTPSQNVLWSLERWNHGAALEEAVRIVRLTRPDVIISLLPDYYTGENHGDHAAAGVIASEAFDMAGDPTVFPEQVGSRRVQDPSILNTEGLHPWQAEKIYFEANPAQADFMKHQGPYYSPFDVSPSRHVPYALLAAQSLSYQLTQGGGRIKELIAGGKLGRFEVGAQLVLGKSLVGGAVTGDVFEGIVPGPIPFVPVRGYQSSALSGISFELDGVFGYYRRFWAAHNLERIANLMPVPQIGITPGTKLPVPLLIRNNTDKAASVDLSVDLPAGWTERAGSARYLVPAHDEYPVQAIVEAPTQGVGTWQKITWHAGSDGQDIGSSAISIYLEARPGAGAN